jgi:hypothetical protein
LLKCVGGCWSMKRHHWLALQGGMRFRRPQPCQGPLNTTDCGQFRQGISEHEDLVRLIGDPRSSIEVIPRYVILKTHHIAMELRAPAVSVGEPEFDRTRRPVSGTEQLVCPQTSRSDAIGRAIAASGLREKLLSLVRLCRIRRNRFGCRRHRRQCQSPVCSSCCRGPQQHNSSIARCTRGPRRPCVAGEIRDDSPMTKVVQLHELDTNLPVQKACACAVLIAVESDS